ncbi:MAG: hypothetical protein ACYC5X_06660 [Syntrophales bacterium]
MESQGKDRSGRADRQTSGQTKWTFLVYMAGDNNPGGAALRDIAEMTKAGSTQDVHVLVQLERIEDQKTRRFRITQGGGFKKDCIETFSETNTGDPQLCRGVPVDVRRKTLFGFESIRLFALPKVVQGWYKST